MMEKTVQKRADSSSKTIFIVEDHPAFREGLIHVLGGEEGLSVCGTAADAAQAYEKIVQLKPDIALLDITLPGKSGLELIKDIRKIEKKVKILVISMHDEALFAERVLRAGGDGYIMKQEDSEEIIQAIRDVLDGHVYVSEAVMARMEKEAANHSNLKQSARQIQSLTDLELEVLGLLGMATVTAELPVH